MGHVMARRLEQGLRLDLGWLDMDHSDSSNKALSEHQLTDQALRFDIEARIRILKKLAASIPD